MPQLTQLDGESIDRSERLKSAQKADQAEVSIIEQSAKYAAKRSKQKEDYFLQVQRGETKTGDDFWNEVSEDTPESRIQMYKERDRQKEENESR